MMTLVEELNAIYDCCKGFRIKVEIIEYDPKSIYLLYYGRSPNGLWYAKRARRSTIQLYFVSAKKESCLPLYIVQCSHKIDERGFVLSSIVILLQLW
jgi:hypothetical protein